MITIADLRKLDACEDASDAFKRAFPSGARSWAEVEAHPQCSPNWRGWIAARAPGLTASEREDFAAQSDDPAYWRGWITAAQSTR